MIDINKIKELKWLLDEGYEINKDNEKEEDSVLGFYDYTRIYKENNEYVFYDLKDQGELEISNKDFDTFCKEVAKVILEEQED